MDLLLLGNKVAEAIEEVDRMLQKIHLLELYGARPRQPSRGSKRGKAPSKKSKLEKSRRGGKRNAWVTDLDLDEGQRELLKEMKISHETDRQMYCLFHFLRVFFFFLALVCVHAYYAFYAILYFVALSTFLDWTRKWRH